MAKYSFTCPAPGCGHVTEVEAANDDEAMTHMMAAGKEHAATVHPDMPAMGDEEMMGMVKASWTKTE